VRDGVSQLPGGRATHRCSRSRQYRIARLLLSDTAPSGWQAVLSSATPGQLGICATDRERRALPGYPRRAKSAGSVNAHTAGAVELRRGRRTARAPRGRGGRPPGHGSESTSRRRRNAAVVPARPGPPRPRSPAGALDGTRPGRRGGETAGMSPRGRPHHLVRSETEVTTTVSRRRTNGLDLTVRGEPTAHAADT
jgi:hypothetical protein